VIGQWQAGMPGPTRGTGRRTSLGGERRPQSEVLEDAPDDSRILDQRNDAHRPVAPGALQRIGLVDLTDQPRPGGYCASRKFIRPLLSRRSRLGGRLSSRAPPARGSSTTPRGARDVRTDPGCDDIEAPATPLRSSPGNCASSRRASLTGRLPCQWPRSRLGYLMTLGRAA